MLHANSTIWDALLAMDGHKEICIAVLNESAPCHPVGLLSIDDFALHFFGFLAEFARPTTICDAVILQHIERACQAFAGSSLRSMFPSVKNTNATAHEDNRYHCVSEDECWFNVVLTLAGGVFAVAVLDCKRQQRIDDDESLLGLVSVFDVLEWLLEDVSLLNGKQDCTISSSSLLCGLTKGSKIAHRGDFLRFDEHMSILHLVAALQSQGSAGVLGHIPLSSVSVDSIVHEFRSTLCEILARASSKEDSSNSIGESLGRTVTRPLKDLLEASPRGFDECHIVRGDDSIAHVIDTMVSARIRRVFVLDDVTRSLCGVVHSRDILRLLLDEQQRDPRFR